MLIHAQVIRDWAVATFSSGFQQFNDSSLVWLLKKVLIALITCIFAAGGAIIGVISGALKGQTTETGILRGVGVGAMTGAITGVQLVELILNGEPFSKVGLICSLINGKIFMEWVSPAILKAYQWQVGTMDVMHSHDVSDLFGDYPISGLPQETISSLPSFRFTQDENSCDPPSDSSCAICLQDLREGETTRVIPSCRHFFHQQCVDVWLSRQGTCPLCRDYV